MATFTGGTKGVNLIAETSGPSTLSLGAVADGQYLQRSGTDLVGASGTDVYDAVVPDTHATLSAAITAGNRMIFVRKGTYLEPAPISVTTESLVIHGEAVAETALVFSSLAPSSVALTFAPVSFVTTGTVTLTQSSNNVTGVGTNFLSIPAGQSLIVGGVLYSIDTVADDLNLTIQETYGGVTHSGLAWYTTPLISFEMKNIVFAGGNVANLDGLVIEGGARTFMQNVFMTGFRDAVTINRCVSTRLDYCFANTNSRRGFYFRDQIGALTCSACNANNNGDEGFRDEPAVGAATANFGLHHAYVSCNAFGNGLDGFFASNNACAMSFSDCTAIANAKDGFNLQAPGVDTKMLSCTSENNAQRGVDAGGNNGLIEMLIDGCTFIDNPTCGIDLTQSNSVTITNNRFYGNAQQSIIIQRFNHVIANNWTQSAVFIDGLSAGQCVIIGNVVDVGFVGDIFLRTGSDENMVQGNQVGQIVVIGDRNVVNGNQFQGNTTPLLDVTGDNTTITGNLLRTTAAATVLEIRAGSNDTVVTGNSLINGGGAKYTDAGTGTIGLGAAYMAAPVNFE